MRYHRANSLNRQIKSLRNVNGMSSNIVKKGVVWIWCCGRRALDLCFPNKIADAPDGFILQVQDIFNKESVNPVRVTDIK